MTREEIRNGLENLFTTIDAPEGERIVFGDIPNRIDPLYQAVSHAMRESGLGFSFSYQVAEKAVWAIIEATEEKTVHEVLENGDIGDAVNAQVPIMSYELATICTDTSGGWERVEDAMATANGSDDYTLSSVLSYAWYEAIDDMARRIMGELVKIETV